MISKKSDIVITIELDENKIPEKMSTKDGGVENQSRHYCFRLGIR